MTKIIVAFLSVASAPEHGTALGDTRWFKYDRDYLFVNKSLFVPVIFESPFTSVIRINTGREDVWLHSVK